MMELFVPRFFMVADLCFQSGEIFREVRFALWMISLKPQ